MNLTDDLGTTRRLTDHSPGMWSLFFRQAVQRLHERDLGFRIGDPSLLGDRICTDAVRKVSNSRKTTQEGKRALAANSCNGI